MATQVAGEQYYDLDGQLAEIKRQIRQSAGYPYDPLKLKTALQNVIEGRFGESNPLFSLATTTKLGPITGKSTKDCFVNSLYEIRSDKFDQLLSTKQLGTDAGDITALVCSGDATAAQWAARILDVSVEMTPGTVGTLGRLLLNRGHAMTLPQVEMMVKRTECRWNSGMCTTMRGNFFFVENKNGGISLARVNVHRPQVWFARTYPFDAKHIFGAGCCLLVRNLDVSKLGL